MNLRTIRPSHVYAAAAAAFVLLVGYEGARMAAGHDPALAAKTQPAETRDDDTGASGAGGAPDGGGLDPGDGGGQGGAPGSGGGFDPNGAPDSGGGFDPNGTAPDSGGGSQLPDTRQS